jgi:hypothetical protein
MEIRRTVTLLSSIHVQTKSLGLRNLRVWQTACCATVEIYGGMPDMSFSLPSLDIFKKDVRGNPVWIDAVEDLEVARFRLSQLASVLPGEYFVFDQRTRRIVVSVPSLSPDGT